ncbi:MAG: cytochrome C oxidase subunit IV family protein [candidate division Zixibacteria bacterium]|nr:cytochrome C oxidase subunit IV family protein [candidate division Zixibacteria bacterium]
MRNQAASAGPHILPLRIYLGVAGALLVLTAITIFAAQADFGSWNLVVALLIAAVKSTLVALFFMHLKYDNRIYSVIFVGAILFLGIFITFTMFDTLNRGGINPLTKMPIKQYAAIYESNGSPIPVSERIYNVSGRIVSNDFFLLNGYGPIKQELTVDPINEKLAASGEKIFNKTCFRCHRLDERFTGPPLGGVTAFRSPAFIMNMILNPEENIRRHAGVQALQKQYYTIMTNQDLSIDEARAVLEYLRSANERAGK